MGIFDLIFPSPSKKIYRENFKKTLHKIPSLSEKERAYVEEVFGGDLGGGLSKFEIQERCRKLMHKTGDELTPDEVEQIKNKLLKYFL